MSDQNNNQQSGDASNLFNQLSAEMASDIPLLLYGSGADPSDCINPSNMALISALTHAYIDKLCAEAIANHSHCGDIGLLNDKEVGELLKKKEENRKKRNMVVGVDLGVVRSVSQAQEDEEQKEQNSKNLDVKGKTNTPTTNDDVADGESSITNNKDYSIKLRPENFKLPVSHDPLLHHKIKQNIEKQQIISQQLIDTGLIGFVKEELFEEEEDRRRFAWPGVQDMLPM